MIYKGSPCNYTLATGGDVKRPGTVIPALVVGIAEESDPPRVNLICFPDGDNDLESGTAIMRKTNVEYSADGKPGTWSGGERVAFEEPDAEPAKKIPVKSKP